MGKGAIYINDSLHGLIRLSEYEKRIIASIGFNRLHDVYQNSTVYLTYPANRTKRFEHSIGTMKLCTDMFYSSISNASTESLTDFFDIAKREIEKAINDLRTSDASRFDMYISKFPRSNDAFETCVSTEGFNRSLIPYSVLPERETIYIILMQSIRVAALLHDIGHPPFSHVVEGAMMEVYVENRDSYPNSDFISTLQSCVGDDTSVHLHERMGDAITSSILLNALSKDTSNSAKNLFEIIIRECVKRIHGNITPFFKGLHSIIDSDLDGDRLDYVTRDPLNSGMSYGSIDYSRLIIDMKMIMNEGVPYFCFPVKAINAAEDFFQRRFNLYKNIIFHHRVKKTDYLLRDIVSRILYNCLDNHVKNDDDAVFDASGLWRPMRGGTSNQVRTDLSQWNDSWLMTFLKSEYYEKYYNNEYDYDTQRENYIIRMEMAELLCNEKHFHSLIKRGEDQRIIDNSASCAMLNILGDIDECIKNLNSVSTEKSESDDKAASDKSKRKGSEENSQNEETTIDIQGMLSYLESIKKYSNRKCILSLSLERARSVYSVKSIRFEDVLLSCVKDACNEFLGDSFIDSIIVYNKYTSGISGEVHFYDNDDRVIEIDEISNIKDVIESEYRFLPIIFVYVLTSDGFTADMKKEILESIGERIGNDLGQVIKASIDELLLNNGGN